MWDVCAWDTSACVGVWTFHVTSAARWESLAIRLHQSLLCPHRPMLGPTPTCQRAGAPNPAVCSRPPFSLCLPFSSPPSLCLFSFVLSPSSPRFSLLFPVCYSSSFLTSRLPPLCHRSSPRSVVQHVSPVRWLWCLIFFVPLKRFRGLNLFKVFILIYTRVKLKRVRFDSTAGIAWILLFRTMSHIHQDNPIQPRDYTHTHTHTQTDTHLLDIWASHTASHMFPLDRAKRAAKGFLIDCLCWYTVNWCHVWLHFYTVHRRLLGSCPINGYKSGRTVLSCSSQTHTYTHTPVYTLSD